MEQTEGETSTPSPGRRGLVGWCVYDWANQAFFTIIITFVYAFYFAQGVAANEVQGLADWAFAIGVSMILVAVTAPPLGAIADQTGRRKPWVFAFTALLILSTAALWFIEPDPSYALLALILVATANFAAESATVFYNAMLPSLAPPERQGRLSGWGFAAGYFGGIVSLLIALFVFALPDPPLFGLDAEKSEQVRATALLVSAWTLLFSIPFFLLTPDSRGSNLGMVESARNGIKALIQTIKKVKSYRQIALFLLARMLYQDGLNTVFSIGAVYAGNAFGMDIDEIMMFGIAITVAAGVGSLAFGWIDDWLGAKRTILLSVGALTALAVCLLLTDDKTWFWAFAMMFGVFFGPAQSASRSFMSRAAPPELVNEMFGLFAFSGKATAFMGPILFGFVASVTESQRAGLASLLLFFVAGFILMLFVKDPQRK